LLFEDLGDSALDLLKGLGGLALQGSFAVRIVFPAGAVVSES
jgi:hypothetical protein